MKHLPLNVMVAEDSEDDIVLIEEALSEIPGLTLSHVARDGVEVLHNLRATADEGGALPDLVFLDINMPVMNGFETLRAIKLDPRLRRVPILMMTVSDREEDVVRSYESGSVTYIRKPLSLEHLVPVLTQLEAYWSSVARVPRG